MKISNFKLGIGLPLDFHMIPSAFFDSFISMEKPPFHYYRASNGPVEEMRNNIVEESMRAGCSHLIMMDTDQVYHPQTIHKLLSHKKDVVGCLVHRRYPPFDPLLLRGEIGKYQIVSEWATGELIEVDATGCGCLLFDMQVFKKMPYPWFRFRKHADGNPIGEDIGFCSELRAAGYRIFVDTSIPAGHLSQMQITGDTWNLYRHLKSVVGKEKQNGIIQGGQ